MMTGTQISGAKGLASPPVMNSSAADLQKVEAEQRAAPDGSSRCVGGKQIDRVEIGDRQRPDQHAACLQRQRKFQPEGRR